MRAPQLQLPSGVQRKFVKRGTKVWGPYYIHRKTGIRLPDDPTSAEFERRRLECERTLAVQPAVIAPDSLHAAAMRYMATERFKKNQPKVQQDQEKAIG